MNKLVGALAVLSASALIASPVNNPASSAQFESGLFTGAQQDYTIRVGYEADAVMDRKVENNQGKAASQTSICRGGLTVSLGLFDRFDVYAALGGASFTSKTRYTGTGTNVTVSTAPGSYWTLGARGDVWSQDNTSVNVFGDYSAMKADVNSILTGTVDSGYTAIKLKGNDWQLGAGIAQTIQVSPDMSVIPALSVRYSGGHYKFNANTVGELKAKSHYGVALACGLFAGKVFGLNLEARFMDETAAAITAEIRI